MIQRNLIELEVTVDHVFTHALLETLDPKGVGGGVLPYITYTGYGYGPPNGFVILKLLI